jgi:hypothetical protein
LGFGCVAEVGRGFVVVLLVRLFEWRFLPLFLLAKDLDGVGSQCLKAFTPNTEMKKCDGLGKMCNDNEQRLEGLGVMWI